MEVRKNEGSYQNWENRIEWIPNCNWGRLRDNRRSWGDHPGMQGIHTTQETLGDGLSCDHRNNIIGVRIICSSRNWGIYWIWRHAVVTYRIDHQCCIVLRNYRDIVYNSVRIIIMAQEKLQYYPSDLSALLGIGDIVDMYIHNENGMKILRITCKEKETGYKTIKPSKPEKSSKKSSSRKTTSKPDMRSLNRDVPGHNIKAMREPDFIHKAVDAGKSWLSKPMRRPDEW